MVGEIDTKPIEPVQNGIYFFGDHKDKGGDDDQKKHQPPPRKNKRHCEKEIEELRKELANCKVQLEAKHAAHMQALLKVEHNQKKIHELSSLLKNSDLERNKYMNERAEARDRREEIESKMRDMVDQQNLETEKLRDQLSHVLSELKANQTDLLNKETELVAARDSELNALLNSEQLKTALDVEKEQKDELNEMIQRLKLDAIEAEKAKVAMLSERDEEIELAKKANAEAQQELEDMRKQIEDMNKFRNNDMEVKGRKIADQSAQIETLETELNELKQEVKMNKERDIKSQVEIALLTSQLQEHRLSYIIGYPNPNPSREDIEVSHEHVRISLEEYKYLVREAEKGNEVRASAKKELENASAKIGEMRARAEQALSRAELAEKAKEALEGKIERYREHRQRRKASLVALREESTPKSFSPSSSSHGTPTQPLGKVLNMKF